MTIFSPVKNSIVHKSLSNIDNPLQQHIENNIVIRVSIHLVLSFVLTHVFDKVRIDRRVSKR